MNLVIVGFIMDNAAMKIFFQIISGVLLKRQPVKATFPIVFLCFIGFVYCTLTFFPGWMSPDSYGQYSDAEKGIYGDWHPVLMAWWWAKLNVIYAGPALMLFQNLLLYWGGWGLLACGARRWLGLLAYGIPLLGFWPGILFPLGQIWKDVFFACSMFFAWTLMINICAQQRRPLWIERVAILILTAFSFGVKTNGLSALPFLIYFWVHLEGWQSKKILRKLLLTMSLSFGAVATAILVVPSDRIVKTSPFQYTQSYDLLAISIKTGEIVLPKYITDRVGTNAKELNRLYWVGGNDVLFYRTSGNLRTTDLQQLKELNEAWQYAISKYPHVYISHRWSNFLELVRIGASSAAYVASPTIIENPWGFSFSMNQFAKWLSLQPDRHPMIFFPWIYMLAISLSMVVLLLLNFQRAMAVTIGASAIGFILPHLFIAPAADYRYLYYSYFCAIILVILSCSIVIRRTVERYKRAFSK